MTTIRTHKETNYSVIDNEPINDSRLSWGARGILVYLLSKPDDWQIYAVDLVNKSPDGKSVVYARLKELEVLGYLHRERMRDSAGKIYWESHIYESPSKNPNYSTVTDNQDMVGLTVTDYPDTVNPDTVNRTLLSTKEQSTKELSTESPPPANSVDIIQDSEIPQTEFETTQQAIKDACMIATSKQNAGTLLTVTRECMNAGKTPEAIRDFGTWFFEVNWPGKYPAASQITSEWPKFEAYKTNPPKQNKNGASKNEQPKPTKSKSAYAHIFD